MSQWKKSASILALLSAAAVVGSGCAAQGADESADESSVAEDHGATAHDAESTGETHQAFGLGGPIFASWVGAQALPFLANPLLGGIGEAGWLPGFGCGGGCW